MTAFTPRDRLIAVPLLSQSAEALTLAVSGLSGPQWRFQPGPGQPGPGKWTVADIVEHLVKSEEVVFRLVLSALASRQPSGHQVPSVMDDEAVLSRVRDRSARYPAAEIVRVTRTWTSTTLLLADFHAARYRTIEYVAATDAALRSYTVDHPVLGMIDAYQWILFLAAHCTRHVAQVEEIKADPDFPGCAIPRSPGALVHEDK